MRLIARLAFLPFVGMVCFTGCGVGDQAPASLQTPLGALRGNVHGGSQPVVGAHVYLFAVGTGGYGGPGISPSAANKSTSLLGSHNLNGFPTMLDMTSGPTGGDYYVTTNASGDFALAGDYTCATNTQVYAYVLGGQPTTSTTNSAAGLMAVLGNCTGGTLAAQVPQVTVNEVSTVAAAYALAGFASDAVHISNGGSTAANAGLRNAAANAAQLYDISGTNGTVALAATPSGNGVVPQATIDSLANSLAACVNSTGPSSSQCSTNLFQAVMSSGTSGTTATDTATEAIYIAQNPGIAVATIYGNTAGIGTPFLPVLSAAPNDWTIGLTFSGGGLNSPQGIAIDSSGDAWVTNVAGNSLSEFGPLGNALSPSAGFTGGGLNQPQGVAIDSTGNVWTTNNNLTISKFLSVGTAAVGSPYSGGALNYPTGIAIDSNNNVWTVNNSQNAQVSEFSSNGTPKSSAGYTDGEYYDVPRVVAIDGSGSAWTAYGVLEQYAAAGVANSNGPFRGGGIGTVGGIAIDSLGDIWMANYGSSISEFANNGTALSSSTGYTGGGVQYGHGIAIDGAGSVWVSSSTTYNGCVSHFTGGAGSSAGTALSPSTGYLGGNINVPESIALDSSGDVWVPNFNGASVTELIGASTPVITPVAAGLPSTLNAGGTSNLGTRP
jgi:hypothetical protein